MCHEPARKRKTDADATRTNHLHVTMIFCGKLRRCPANDKYYTPPSPESRGTTGFCVRPRSRRAHACRLCAGWFYRTWCCRLIPRCGKCRKTGQKRKTRPGGQPDGSSHMGAWGGWALAPNTASMGRDNRSHIHWSQQGRRTFKGPRNFFNFLRGVFLDRNRGFGAEFIARQRDWPRRRSTCPRPWRLPAGSGPVSGEPAVGPGHLLRRAPAKPRRPAPPVRR